MGYSTAIKGNVKKAFNLLKDLATVVTFTNRLNTGFNFATNTVTGATSTSKSLKVLVVDKKRDSSEELTSTLKKTLLLKSEDLGDPSIYDTVTLANGEVWNMVPPHSNDGYVLVIQLAREM